MCRKFPQSMFEIWTDAHREVEDYMNTMLEKQGQQHISCIYCPRLQVAKPQLKSPKKKGLALL